MDYAEQLFALHVHLEVSKIIEEELKEGGMTQGEIEERVEELTRYIVRSTDDTARVIREIRSGA